MRILFSTDAIAADRAGGVAHSMATEALELARRGHDVRVLTRRQVAGTALQERVDGLETTRTPGPLLGSRFYYLHPLVTLLRGPGALRRLHAAWPFDVVYVHSTFHAHALSRARLPVAKILSFHASAAEEIAIDVAAKKYGRLNRLVRSMLPAIAAMERRAVRAMDFVRSDSDFMKGRMAVIDPGVASRTSTVPLMVDTDRFPYVESCSEARNTLGLPLDRSIMFTVRRLVPRMGLEALVEAMATIAEMRPDSLLLIGGRGYLEDGLRQQIKARGLANHIRLLGYIPDTELPTYYSACDLFVLPTAELEGFGLVTLEALSTGRLTVATPIGGNLEVVGGFEPGLLAADESAASIAEVALRWLDPARELSWRKKARQHAESHYSREGVGDILEPILTETKCHARR